MTRFFWTLALIVALTLFSCTTTGAGWNTAAQSGAVVEKVLTAGRSLVGQRPEAHVVINGKSFVLDCVGTVSAAWWAAGVDLQRDFAKYRGDGVNRLYNTLQSWGALHWLRTPSPGDLIVWDHTWDVGGDPNYPDGHTHVGLVLNVRSDGTIEYLHESTTRGIVVAYMNLYDPAEGLSGDRVINSPMFLGSGFGKRDNPPQWTSGQLWSAFGDGAVVARAGGG